MRNLLKSMSRLGLVLLVLTSTAAASAEGDLWWAFAEVGIALGDTGYYRDGAAYGAAWNFPSREEAEKAALEACAKEDVPHPSWSRPHVDALQYKGCAVRKSGKNSCFAVVKYVTHDKYWGTYTGFGYVGSYPSHAETEAEAKRGAADTYSNDSGVIQIVGSVELVECSGVE